MVFYLAAPAHSDDYPFSAGMKAQPVEWINRVNASSYFVKMNKIGILALFSFITAMILFKKVLDLVSNKEHRSEEGLKKILTRSGMNQNYLPGSTE